jgi:hypothetical protein
LRWTLRSVDQIVLGESLAMRPMLLFCPGLSISAFILQVCRMVAMAAKRLNAISPVRRDDGKTLRGSPGSMLKSVAAVVLTTLSPPLAGAQVLCVTSGVIRDAPGGLHRVEGPSVRAVVNGSEGSSAELRFRYLGPSEEVRTLASGRVRRQIGLKLRAHDACNLVYAIWRFEPESAIVVSMKINPGQSRSAQCHAEGYRNIAPEVAAVPPQVAPGRWQVLRAETRGAELIVKVDGRSVWRGKLPAAASALEGPAGLRSDNAQFEFSLSATASARVSRVRCAGADSD